MSLWECRELNIKGMEKILKALRLLIASGEGQGEFIRGLRLSSLILDVYPEEAGHALAMAGVVYLSKGIEEVRAKDLGEGVWEKVKALREAEGDIQGVERLPDELMLVVCCEWLHKVEKAAIDMRMNKGDWEYAQQILPIVRGRLGESNASLYANQLGIHLEVLKTMGWVYQSVKYEN
jgi:hypothetical protein